MKLGLFALAGTFAFAMASLSLQANEAGGNEKTHGTPVVKAIHLKGDAVQRFELRKQQSREMQRKIAERNDSVIDSLLSDAVIEES